MPVPLIVAWSILTTAAVLCVAPSSSAQSVAAAAPAAQTDAIERVTADLSAGTFDRVLPFDVPFFVTGTAPEGTVRLEVQYAEVPRSGVLSGAPLRPAVPAAWQPEAATAADQTFLVFIRETLDAERYYQFRFTFLRQPSADQILKFRQGARGLFDERLRLVNANSVPLATTREIREDLVAIVRAVAGSAKWEPVRGSHFDTTDESAAALVAFLQEAAPLLAAQNDRRAVLATFVEARLLLRTALAAIRSTAALQTVRDAAQKLGDPAVAELLKLDADGLALLQLGDPDLDLVAAGGVFGDLADVWSPEGAAARRTNYDQTFRRLEQLAHFLRAVSDSGGAARPLLEPVVGAAALNQVAALLAPGGALAAALTLTRRLTLDMGRLEQDLTDRQNALTRLTELISLLFRDERLIEGSSVADGETAQNNYISADAGVLYAGDIGAASLFLGTNIYLRPVNKNAPLSLKGGFRRRFAFTIGVTVSSIADEGNRTRSDLFSNQSLVLGAGIRLTPSIRVGGGALVFNETNPNPLITHKEPAASWYTSFTFDINVAKGLQGLGGQFK